MSNRFTLFKIILILLLSAILFTACIQEQHSEAQVTDENETHSGSEGENETHMEGSCTIPDLTSLDEETASSFLESMGLHPIRDTHEDDHIPEGFVIETIPMADTELNPCSGDVTYVISLGSLEDLEEWEGWETASGDPVVAIHIEEGRYIWETQTENTPLTIKLMPEAPQPGNFNIAVDIEDHSSSANALSGIIFNYTDQENFFAFSILKSGVFMIVQRSEGEWIDHSPGNNTYSGHGTPTHLSIGRYGAEYLFYIDEVLVAQEGFINQPSLSQAGLMLQVTSGMGHIIFDNFLMTTSDYAAIPTETPLPVLPTPTPTRSMEFIYILEDFEFYKDDNFSVKSFGGGNATREISDEKTYKWTITSGSAFKHRAVLKELFGNLSETGYSIEMDALQISGESGICSYGILYNYDDSSGDGNVFEISGDHTCSMTALGESGNIQSSDDCQISSETFNHLRVDLHETKIEASLNGTVVLESEISENTPINQGAIGIQVDCSSESLSVFEFDNIKVFEGQ